MLIIIADLDSVIALSNVTAILAMLIVNVAAFRLARQRWPGPGLHLPAGVLIPSLAFLLAAAQLPSLGWDHVAVGTSMVLGGLFIYALRHRPELSADVGPVLRAIEVLETPVARALRPPLGFRRPARPGPTP